MANARKVILAAAGANLGIAIAKFVAWGLTGSSAMLTEAIHSVVDTGNQGLLLVGQGRARKKPNASHPFGYGMEAYFWSFIVALMIFALGGALAIREGFHKLAEPEAMDRPWINLIVLGVAILLEGASFRVALKEFNTTRQGQGFWASIRGSKDPALFAVLLEDAAALFGLIIALVGVTLAAYLGLLWADAVASIAIGVLLIAVAIFLANETRSLLAGEAASPALVRAVMKVLKDDPAVVEAPEVLSLHLGPSEILFAITLDFDDSLPGGEIERRADALTLAITGLDPRITRVFLRPGRIKAGVETLNPVTPVTLAP